MFLIPPISLHTPHLYEHLADTNYENEMPMTKDVHIEQSRIFSVTGTRCWKGEIGSRKSIPNVQAFVFVENENSIQTLYAIVLRKKSSPLCRPLFIAL